MKNKTSKIDRRNKKMLPNSVKKLTEIWKHFTIYVYQFKTTVYKRIQHFHARFYFDFQ